MKKASSSHRGGGILLVAFVVIAIILGVLVLKKIETSQQKPQSPPQSIQSGTKVVALFFAAQDGSGLIREGREIESDDDLEMAIEDVVVELVSGPVGDNAPTLPSGTRIIGVHVLNDTAEIDFGKELSDGLPSGSSAEMLAVYSIVDSIVVNYPQIRKVKFLIEGATVATMKGHLDISKPVEADMTLEK